MLHLTTSSLKPIFRFPFEGEDWKKRFLVGAGLNLAGMCIPILPTPFVYGYIVEVMRRIIWGGALELPAWDDWGRLGADGLGVTLVGLVCLLPGLLLYLGGTALYMFGSFAMPFIAMFAVTDPTATALIFFVAALFAQLAVAFVSMALGSLLLVAGIVPLPVAVAHMAAGEKIAAAWRVRECWRILRANALGFAIDCVILAGLSALLYTVLIVLYYSVVPCLLVPVLTAPAVFYIILVGAARFAQSYRCPPVGGSSAGGLQPAIGGGPDPGFFGVNQRLRVDDRP